MAKITNTQYLIISLLAVSLIGIVDYATTSTIKIIAFYLIPIFITSYYINIRYGLFIATIAVAINFTIVFLENPVININILVNNIMLLIVYYVVVYIVNQLRKKNILIEESLKEKEIILREIHHRIKNQISTLISIVNMSTADDADKILLSISSRLKTYMLLYENLCYDSKSQSTINLVKYLKEIAEYIVRTRYGDTQHVNFSITGSSVHLDNKNAITIGLIINELITNTLKHASSENTVGKIDIDVQKINDNGLSIRYRDNSAGFDFSESIKKNKLGIVIISSLIKQLKGSIDYSREKGSEFLMTFKQMETYDSP